MAKAILYAAEHPKREIMVGGSGVVQTRLAHYFPSLADRVFAWGFYRFAVDESRPNRGRSALYAPDDDRRKLGDQGGYLRKTSIATYAQLNPGVSLVAGLMLGAVAALWLLRSRG